MSLFVAILTAAGFAIFGFPFRFYQCWLSWSRVGAPAGVLTYMVLAGGGGGLIGWLAAYLARVPSSASPVIDGFFYGIAGTLTVRADFRSGHGIRHPPEVRAAASLLGKGIEWSTAALDEITRRRAKRWLERRHDNELLRLALDLVNEIKTDKRIPPQTKTAIGKQALAAMSALTSAQDTSQNGEGRSRLTYFCLELMVNRHMAKP
jgi:hypothetical protein